MDNPCKFELDTAQAVRDHISSIQTVEMKFKCINMLENFLSKIRHELAEEYTYCAGCNQYVKVADRVITEEDGYQIQRCGSCGIMHRRSKIF